MNQEHDVKRARQKQLAKEIEVRRMELEALNKEQRIEATEKPMEFKLAEAYPPVVWYLIAALLITGCGMNEDQVSAAIEECNSRGEVAQVNEAPYSVVISVDCH